MPDSHLSAEHLNFFACDSADMKINEAQSPRLKAFRLALQSLTTAPPLESPGRFLGMLGTEQLSTCSCLEK